MLRHQGQERTHQHNLQLASLLSVVAGAVNAIGFLELGRLTTNVTGHFAFAMEDVLRGAWPAAALYSLFVLSFLAGAFVSNTQVEFSRLRGGRHPFRAPVLLEMGLLLAAWVFWRFELLSPEALACLLLLAMGAQNALVTKISKAVVRTTHLTGLFTDLGIELSQWLFHRKSGERHALQANIRLRMRIIGGFFGGGLAGGVLYGAWQFGALLLPLAVLLWVLFWDARSSSGWKAG